MQSKNKHDNVKDLKFNEAVFNDKQLNFLNQKRFRIISLVTPISTIDKDGKIKTIWIDEYNHPQLKTIEELIDIRTEEIKNHYNEKTP